MKTHIVLTTALVVMLSAGAVTLSGTEGNTPDNSEGYCIPCPLAQTSAGLVETGCPLLDGNVAPRSACPFGDIRCSGAPVSSGCPYLDGMDGGGKIHRTCPFPGGKSDLKQAPAKQSEKNRPSARNV